MKIGHFLLFFSIFWMKNSQIFAQIEKPVEVETIIYLKNNVVVRGHLVKWVQNDYLIIKTRDSLELQFSETQIYKMQQKRYGGTPEIVNRSYRFREKGWYNASYLGLIVHHHRSNFDGDQINLPTFNFSNATGWQINRIMGIGAGFGLDHYGRDELLYFVPVFVDFRTYLTRQNRAPYFNLMAGRGIAVEKKADEINAGNVFLEKAGGLFFSPNFGYRFGANPTSNWTLDVGMRLQKASYTIFNFGTTTSRDILYRRYTIRVGLIF